MDTADTPPRRPHDPTHDEPPGADDAPGVGDGAAGDAGDDDARRYRRLTIGLLALLVGLLFLLWDWNWFKGPIERRVEAATGREFRIEGDLDVELHWSRPTIVANDVMLGNAAWSAEPEMFRVGQARIQWAVWKLLAGDVVLPRIDLRAPALRLERSADGDGNWRFRYDPEAQPDYPQIGQLQIVDGRIRILEPTYDTDIDVAVASEPVGDDGTSRLRVDGKGSYRAADFSLEGHIGSPLQFLAADASYDVDLRARAGATRAHAFGALPLPVRPDDFAIGFELAGADMAQLYPLLGLAIPKTPPYRLEGRLERRGQVWHYREFSGVVGDSDLAGDASVDPSRERTLLTAVLVSRKVDFDDLAGFIGGTPRSGEGDAAVGAVPGDPSRVFPAREYDVAKLRAMDADVRWRVARLESPKLPLDSMDAHARLVDGDLRLDPLEFGVAGGEIRSTVHLDARQSPILAEVDLRARRLDLHELAKLGAPESQGRIGGRIQFSARGNSVAALMASADGEAQLGMGRGRISNLLLELAGIDIYEALKFMLGKDRVIPIRCAYADLAIADGVAASRQTAFDTTDTVLFVEGDVDLGEERFDLRLKPRPKDPSPISLRSPLRLTGDLKHPKVRPEAGPLILRGALAVALYAIAPPAAILALIETGPGEDTGCGTDNPKLRAETDADTNAGPPSEN